jgi:hypothetical protein
MNSIICQILLSMKEKGDNRALPQKILIVEDEIIVAKDPEASTEMAMERLWVAL